MEWMVIKLAAAIIIILYYIFSHHDSYNQYCARIESVLNCINLEENIQNAFVILKNL